MMNETVRNEIATFRFGLIAQVVQRQLQPGERYALLRTKHQKLGEEQSAGIYTIGP